MRISQIQVTHHQSPFPLRTRPLSTKCEPLSSKAASPESSLKYILSGSPQESLFQQGLQVREVEIHWNRKFLPEALLTRAEQPPALNLTFESRINACPQPAPLLFCRNLTNFVLSSVQFCCSVVSNSVTQWTAACQVSLSITNSQSLLKVVSIKLMMPSNHLIFCHPLLPSCLHSFPASGSFPMSQFFASAGQRIGVSASASVLYIYIYIYTHTHKQRNKNSYNFCCCCH